MKNTKFLVQAAVIAAIYVVLTISFGFISFGQLQFRVSEALTILPYFTPAAIPGLFIGCLIANMSSPFGLVDIVFGSLATLTAAFLTYKMPKMWLAPLPPVLVNALVVALILNYAAGAPLLITMLWVGLGQIVSCYLLGGILMVGLKRVFNQ